MRIAGDPTSADVDCSISAGPTTARMRAQRLAAACSEIHHGDRWQVLRWEFHTLRRERFLVASSGTVGCKSSATDC